MNSITPPPPPSPLPFERLDASLKLMAALCEFENDCKEGVWNAAIADLEALCDHIGSGHVVVTTAQVALLVLKNIYRAKLGLDPLPIP